MDIVNVFICMLKVYSFGKFWEAHSKPLLEDNQESKHMHYPVFPCISETHPQALPGPPEILIPDNHPLLSITVSFFMWL